MVKRLERVQGAQAASGKSTRDPRRSVALTGFGVLDDGTIFDVVVLDLSYDGCRVETAAELAPGLKLRVSILGLGGALNAVVRWQDGSAAGLFFDKNAEPKLAVRHPGSSRWREAAQSRGGPAFSRSS